MLHAIISFGLGRFCSQADAAEFDRRSQRSIAHSAAGRTACASEWGHTAVFSDAATETGRTVRTGRGGRAGSVAGGTTSRAGGPRGVQLEGDAAAADPQDLLKASTARQLVRSAAGAGGRAPAGGGVAAAEFPRSDDGRMLIEEEKDDFAWNAGKGKKAKRYEHWQDSGVGMALYRSMRSFDFSHLRTPMACITPLHPSCALLACSACSLLAFGATAVAAVAVRATQEA